MKKRIGKTILLAMVLFVGIAYAVPMFSPWSRINCEEQEIDINSGRMRTTRYFYWIPILRQVGDTGLSRQLGNSIPINQDAQWHRVIACGPFTSHSPHYAFHSAFYQARMLELIWDEYEIAPIKRMESARELLKQWQLNGSDRGGNSYLSKITEEAK